MHAYFSGLIKYIVHSQWLMDIFILFVWQPVDFSQFPYADKKFEFFDHYLISCIHSKKDKDILEFFKLLSLCHTVMVEEKEGERNLIYWNGVQIPLFLSFFIIMKNINNFRCFLM